MNRDSQLVMQTHDLGISYGKHRAFDRVSLDLHKGRVTAVIGPSGCGKSSFLACLNRLALMIPGCSMDGHVLLEGTDTALLDVTELRCRVGMIFQKPNPFPLSIRRNLELPLREHGMKQRDRLRETVEQVLGQVGLWDEVKDRLNSPALALSGGQQQRLCIARALALKPEVLLMDEPCSALDPMATRVIEDLITGLRDRYSVVVVTHNLPQARRVADHAAFFWHKGGCGRLIEWGPAQELFTNPKDALTVEYISGRAG